MNKIILKSGPQEFIHKNWNTDILSLLLKNPIFEGVSQQELVEQLEAKKKCQKKLPTWFTTLGIYYPNKLNIEQASSERTAMYKTRLVKGTTLLDMTGGIGIDSYYFSKKIERVTHCELNTNLSEIAAHNFSTLGASNCTFIAQDGIQFLETQHQEFDWIYIDPSRRPHHKGKVFRLEDCEPNVILHLNLLFKHTNEILIKASPLLDLTNAIRTLSNVSQIHIVAIENEVKEVLLLLTKNYESNVKVVTINIKKEKEEHFEFLYEQEMPLLEYEMPQNYLYEPNAAILKSGGFNKIPEHYQVKKLAVHSHLYTSEQNVEFPGRVFKIEEVIAYSKKNMKRFLRTKANVTTRNFPEAVALLRKKYQIQDGGECYLFFTQDNTKNKIVIKCTKVKDHKAI